MTRYVISKTFGQLIEGYNRTNAELSALVLIPSPSAAQRERAHMLLQERSEWREVMDRCPMFLDEEVRHG